MTGTLTENTSAWSRRWGMRGLVALGLLATLIGTTGTPARAAGAQASITFSFTTHGGTGTVQLQVTTTSLETISGTTTVPDIPVSTLRQVGDGQSVTVVEPLDSAGRNLGGYFPFALDCLDFTANNTHLGTSFTAVSGHIYFCYVTNNKPATVNVTKQVVHWPTDLWQFDFSLTSSFPAATTLDDADLGVSQNDPSVSWQNAVVPGIAYTLSEVWPPSTDDPKATDIDCKGGATFVPLPGETINCTVTNYGDVPLGLNKTSYGADATFTFVVDNGVSTAPLVTTSGGDATGIGHGTTYIGLQYDKYNPTYTVVESNLPDWVEGPVSCTVTHEHSGTSTTTEGGFTLDSWGDSVECTTENMVPADVSLSKAVTGNPSPAPGDATQFTMTITNHSGSIWATKLRLKDPMPQHLIAVSTPTAGCVIFANVLDCDVDPIAPGESRQFVVNVVVAEDAPVGFTLTNEAFLYQLDVEAGLDDNIGDSAAVLGIVPTGSESQMLTLAALALLLVGASLTFAGRRRTA